MKSINALLNCITTTANAASSSIVAAGKVTSKLCNVADQQSARLEVWSNRTYKETCMYSQREEAIMPLRYALEQSLEEKKLLEEAIAQGLDSNEVVELSKKFKK